MGVMVPDGRAGTLAVTEPRAVKGNNPVLSRRHVDQATALEVLDHAAIAVDQCDRCAMTRVDVMKADPVDLDELTLWSIVPFSITREILVPYGDTCKPYSGEDA